MHARWVGTWTRAMMMLFAELRLVQTSFGPGLHSPVSSHPSRDRLYTLSTDDGVLRTSLSSFISTQCSAAEHSTWKGFKALGAAVAWLM